MAALVAAAPLSGVQKEQVRAFLRAQGLTFGDDAEYTALLYEGDAIVATGSLCGQVLKYIAVSELAQGEGACAAIVSALVQQASRWGRSHLFLYTKPGNKALFSSLGFYALVQTADILMMENRKLGLASYLASLERGLPGTQGAVVANCNPFTLGHRYLMEQAAGQVTALHVFVVSEDTSFFPAALRYEMVKKGTADIPNICLHQSESYLVSAATFPTYFLKDGVKPELAQADLDIALFGARIAPALGISLRFVGTEPFCEVTAQYNARLREQLPGYGIALRELPRKDNISASAVRAAIQAGDWERVRQLTLPQIYDDIRSFADANTGGAR
ncbi:MAG: [citrate (pro-3S)-lyase] ligase [Christensenellaceae bacterium]|jgi:[citrate (pro-3S)-lyase] ligase|nr:[citrate (pro-3S)-lyase] ligase [Christensenellaceae bacterium]